MYQILFQIPTTPSEIKFVSCQKSLDTSGKLAFNAGSPEKVRAISVNRKIFLIDGFVQARELERQLGVVKHKEICLQRLHDQFRYVVKTRPPDPALEVDEIRARDFKLLEKQFESLNLLLRDTKQMNETVKFQMDEEILQKVAALEKVQQLEVQIETVRDQLLSEKQIKEETLNALASSQCYINNSNSEILEANGLIDVLLQKVNVLGVSPQKAQTAQTAGSMKEKLIRFEELLALTFSSAASLEHRVNCLESELVASRAVIRTTESQRDDILDGLSRWESTCSLMEKLHVEQSGLYDRRAQCLQARLKISDCKAIELERHIHQRNDSLRRELGSISSELQDSNRHVHELLSEVAKSSSLVYLNI